MSNNNFTNKKQTAEEAGIYKWPKSYCGCAGDLPFDDKRLPNMINDYENNGFDDTELWSLDLTIIQFITPRLKRFREINPCNQDIDYNAKIDFIIMTFDKIIKDGSQLHCKDMADTAIKYLSEIWFSLWY